MFATRRSKGGKNEYLVVLDKRRTGEAHGDGIQYMDEIRSSITSQIEK